MDVVISKANRILGLLMRSMQVSAHAHRVQFDHAAALVAYKAHVRSVPRFLQMRLRHESRDKYVIHISKTAFKKRLFWNAALLCEYYGAAEQATWLMTHPYRVGAPPISMLQSKWISFQTLNCLQSIRIKQYFKIWFDVVFINFVLQKTNKIRFIRLFTCVSYWTAPYLYQ